jgi:anti-sigma factor RsiW
MSKHVTAEQIAQYKNKLTPPGELLAFDRHVSQCGECRSQLTSLASVRTLLSGLEAAARAPEHLSYDEMADYVDGKCDDADREVIESHVELCERCAIELGDLAAFAETLSASGEAEPSPLLSQTGDLGAISFAKKGLRVRINAGEDEEDKTR